MRMLGLRATKWVTFMPHRNAKNSGRRQARAIDARERMAQIEAEYPEPYQYGVITEWSRADVEEAEAAYETHPWTSGEGRCPECLTDRIDAFVYVIRCNPDRLPVTYTSESRSSSPTKPGVGECKVYFSYPSQKCIRSKDHQMPHRAISGTEWHP